MLYIYVYIYIYKSQISRLSLMSSHSLRPSIYLLSPYKLAFHCSPAWEIVSRIMPVTSGDFSYSYFTCNMSFKESLCTLQTLSIDIRIDHRKPHHRTSCCLNMAYDWIQPYQIMQTIGNSAMILSVSVSYVIWAWRSRNCLSIHEFRT